MKYCRKVMAMLLVSTLVSACTSRTMIRTSPQGAKVYLNGEFLGETPYSYKDKKIVGSTNQLVLKKEGYKEFSTSFSRDEELSVGALIGGLFVVVPFFWIMKYKPDHIFELEPSSASK